MWWAMESKRDKERSEGSGKLVYEGKAEDGPAKMNAEWQSNWVSRLEWIGGGGPVFTMKCVLFAVMFICLFTSCPES